MYQYRHALARMRQGDSDRDIARSKLMGRKKIALVRNELIHRQAMVARGASQARFLTLGRYRLPGNDK
jgi:hypothetical protein